MVPMSSQVAVGPFQSASGRSMVAALREDSTSFGLDGIHSLSFDRAGRLIRTFWEGRSIRRSLDNRPQSEILNRQGHPAPALGTRNAKTEMADWGEGTELLNAP